MNKGEAAKSRRLELFEEVWKSLYHLALRQQADVESDAFSALSPRTEGAMLVALWDEIRKHAREERDRCRDLCKMERK